MTTDMKQDEMTRGRLINGRGAAKVEAPDFTGSPTRPLLAWWGGRLGSGLFRTRENHGAVPIRSVALGFRPATRLSCFGVVSAFVSAFCPLAGEADRRAEPAAPGAEDPSFQRVPRAVWSEATSIKDRVVSAFRRLPLFFATTV